MKLILPVIIILLCLMAFTVNAARDYEVGWHEAKKCNPCHESILPEASSKQIFDGCLCHYPPQNPIWHTEVEIVTIKELHGIKPCIKCHISSIGTINQENIHRLHGPVECEKCHGIEDIKEPDISYCNSCHGSEIHGIHETRLDDLCITCHGEFGANTISQFESSDLPISADINSINKKSREDFPTIMNVLRSLLKLINF